MIVATEAEMLSVSVIIQLLLQAVHAPPAFSQAASSAHEHVLAAESQVPPKFEQAVDPTIAPVVDMLLLISGKVVAWHLAL